MAITINSDISALSFSEEFVSVKVAYKVKA